MKFIFALPIAITIAFIGIAYADYHVEEDIDPQLIELLRQGEGEPLFSAGGNEVDLQILDGILGVKDPSLKLGQEDGIKGIFVPTERGVHVIPSANGVILQFEK